ncbi:MAG: class I SAM-dependent methyltransferase [Candidatus Izemoplasma sp.]|nr:class I SAM-dependent methyltransferase [Candidatus Izemoplasma sp.]
MRLSKRLNICLKYTDGFYHLADIGTDHAKVPIAAVNKGYVVKAQAIDNKHGPYVIAYSNVKKAGLLDRITVKLSDGLADIEQDTDVVIISGMGGITIRDIILNGPRYNIKRFILQPNDNTEALRRSLQSIDYTIVDELVFADKDKLYDLIVIEPGQAEYTDLEYQFGPINLRQKPHFFEQKINKELSYLTTVINHLDNPDEHPDLLQRHQSLKEALAWKEPH